MNNPATRLKSDYCIEIDYRKDSENPSRVFRTMSNLIESFQIFDKKLVGMIDVNIEPVVLLEDIESGSIKAWLRTTLKLLPDEALLNLDWKPLIGQFLVRAKKACIDYTNGTTTITNITDIKPLENTINLLAEQANVKLLPAYNPIKPRELLEGMKDMSESLSYLTEGDKVNYITPSDGESRFNLTFKLTPDHIEDLITKEILTSDGVKILKVKKPDYLGESMWDFKHGNNSLQANILDKEWLSNFQTGQVLVVPGDSLKVNIREENKYDHNNYLIGQHFQVNEILEVIHNPDMFKGN
jgi:hypothetical protein